MSTLLVSVGFGLVLTSFVLLGLALLRVPALLRREERVGVVQGLAVLTFASVLTGSGLMFLAVTEFALFVFTGLLFIAGGAACGAAGLRMIRLR